MKIFLIGMPGSGKSTLGRELAGALSMPFHDLDTAIVNREGRTIPEIFSESGEDHFRLTESTLLREFCAREGSFVLATGGGAPCFFDNMSLLNQSGLTIYLDVPVETLLARTARSTGRPLLGTLQEREERMRKLYESRQECYSMARLIVRQPDLEAILSAVARTGIRR